MYYKTARKLSYILVLLAIIILILGLILHTLLFKIICFALAALGILLYFILNIRFWRCPYCGTRFELVPFIYDKMNLCPYCGEELEK